MSCRCFSQYSLTDSFVKAYSRVGGFLEDLAKTIWWPAFEIFFRQVRANTMGTASYPRLTTFKIVLLQQWYKMPDPQADEAVRDRPSYRRFCGIPLDAATPDHSSIWRLRQTVDKLGLSAKPLAKVNGQLDAQGLVVKRGTVADATIVAAAVKRPPFEEGPVNLRDPDASYSVKSDRTYFGYKAHLAVDEGSDLIRQAEMISADLHDSQRSEAMNPGRRSGVSRRQGLRQPSAAGETRRARDRRQGQAQQAAGQLAEVVQHDGFKRAHRGRALRCDCEGLVWNGAGSLSRVGAQRLLPAIRRLRDEYEARACACSGRLEPS